MKLAWWFVKYYKIIQFISLFLPQAESGDGLSYAALSFSKKESRGRRPRREPPPDAVYAASDYAALGALQVMQEHNVSVPKDIALVGFSNEPFTSLVHPSISTVSQHSGEIGKIAANTFLKRINQKNWKPKLTKNILKSELIIRESSNKNQL